MNNQSGIVMTNIREIHNLLYDAPHRLNDSHVEYLLQTIDYLKEDLEKVEADYNALINQQRERSQQMVSGWIIRKTRNIHKGVVMKPVLIIVRGVSGSGKSTFAEWLESNLSSFAYTATQKFEADQWFVDNDEPWNPRYLQTAHEWCQAEVKKSLQAGCVTIVSNTTTTKKELDPYIKIATDLGVQYFVLISDSDYNNVHGVDDDKLKKQGQRFYFNNTVMQDSGR